MQIVASTDPLIDNLCPLAAINCGAFLSGCCNGNFRREYKECEMQLKMAPESMIIRVGQYDMRANMEFACDDVIMTFGVLLLPAGFATGGTYQCCLLPASCC